MLENPLAYIPMDRRQALARGESLPEQTTGAALFADISGFTPLTEALVRELGRQRGAEELTRYLNLVYDALIHEIHRFGGSAIAFAGDAITCWFDGDNGARATAAALAMQDAMLAFVAVQTPFGSTVALGMKASVAAGPVRRWLVGDPAIRVIDAMAGSLLERLAAGEHVAQRGEVLVDEATLQATGALIDIADERPDKRAGGSAAGSPDEPGRCFYVVGRLTRFVSPTPWPPLDPARIAEDEVRRWLLPTIYTRLQHGSGQFLAEIRPTVALFLRFGGIDYDRDPDAGRKLDAYVRWLQHVLDRYQGTLIDLNIGDKGSYIYINFGAPIAHEDDADRACAAALEIRALPPDLAFIGPVQIGITHGRMRCGAYGGSEHRTYGALGDSVNLAARLMMKAAPGQIYVSETAHRFAIERFVWEDVPPLRVKGKSEPVVAYALVGTRRRSAFHRRASAPQVPLIGREADVAVALERLALAAQGRGQIVSLVGDPGIGKSRMVDALAEEASRRGFAVFGGECEAYGAMASYQVWQPIWRGLFAIDEMRDTEAQVGAQIAALEARVGAIDAALARRVPLLGMLLGLAIPDNDLTRGFDAKLRKVSLEGLLADCLRALASEQPLLLVLENGHWLDPLSHDLLESLGRALAGSPVLIVVAYRPLDLARLQEARVEALPNHTSIRLVALESPEMERLARTRLTQLPGARARDALPPALVDRIVQQAEGNPLYVEELVNFLHSNGIDPHDAGALRRLELPSSLQALVLSRIDLLPEQERTTLKVASVVGRVFRTGWLWGVYPDLGAPPQVRATLAHLAELEIVEPDRYDPESAYSFKQIVGHSVVYESLLHTLRTTLHEQIGRFIEQAYAGRLGTVVDLLAFHYDRAANVEKSRIYLWQAGDAAQAAYANEPAIDYYQRVLPLLEPGRRIGVLLSLGEVLRRVGRWEEAAATYRDGLALAAETGSPLDAARCSLALGDLLRNRGDYAGAGASLEAARAGFEAEGDRAGAAQVLHVAGTLAAQQGDYATARRNYHTSLALRRALGDRDGEARLLSNLAILAEYESDLPAALALQEESLAIRRTLGNRATIANSLNNLGNVLLAQGDFAGARLRQEEAVVLQREIGDRWGLANALNNLGNAARALGDYVEARRLYVESLGISRALGDGWALAYLIEDIGGLEALEGRHAAALALVGVAETLRQAIGAPLPPGDQAKLDALLAGSVLALGEAGAEAARAGGRALPLDRAIDGVLRGA